MAVREDGSGTDKGMQLASSNLLKHKPDCMYLQCLLQYAVLSV